MRVRSGISLLVFSATAAVAPTTFAHGIPVTPAQSSPQSSAGQGAHAPVECDFDEAYLSKAYNQTKTGSGRVVLSAKGTQVAYAPGSAPAGPGAADVLSLIANVSNLSQTFQLQTFAGNQIGYPAGYVLALSPIVATPNVVKLLLYVDQASSEIRRGMVIDAQGNRHRFDFKNCT